jgi:epoxyqueuosine reductase
VFGCDVCQEVCPFNAGAGEPHDPHLAPRTLDHALPDLVALAGKGANQMRRFVRRTALRRIPRDLLLRNTAVALGNTGAPEAVPALVALLDHPAPLVRGHAAWALGRLAGPNARAALDARAALETDPYVRDELSAARGTPGSPRTPPPPSPAPG